MKNVTKVVMIVVVIFVISSFTNIKSNEKYEAITAFQIPEHIQKIFEKSCYGCHNSNSKGKKSKMKFNIDKMTNGKYFQKKIASKLRKISKLVNDTNEKKMMPPKKFLNHYPDKALSDDDKKAITEWANSQNEIIKSELNK